MTLLNRLILCMIVALSFAACSEKKESETPLLQAYRLIDENRTDEAIDLLEREIAVNPEDQEIRSTLASAYAHKAGIKIQALAPVFFNAKTFSELREKTADDSRKATRRSRGSQDPLQGVVFAFHQMSTLWSIYQSIPVLTEQSKSLITHAIEVLNASPDNLNGGSRVYRALLRAVLLKNMVETDLFSDAHLPEAELGENCRIDLSRSKTVLLKLHKTTDDIFADLIFANPSQTQSLRDAASQLSKNVEFAVNSIEGLKNTERAEQVLANDLSIQQNFPSLVECVSP